MNRVSQCWRWAEQVWIAAEQYRETLSGSRWKTWTNVKTCATFAQRKTLARAKETHRTTLN